jgi:hypothetical protein
MKKAVPALVIVLALVGGAYAHSGEHGGGAKFTKHFNETLFAISEKGQVSIEVLLDEKEYKIGKDVIGIVVHDRHDEDVEGARLEVTVAGSAEPLKATEKGGGLYLVPAAGFPKDGKWELRIAVKKGKIDDGAAFSYPAAMKTAPRAGKYDAEMMKEKK